MGGSLKTNSPVFLLLNLLLYVFYGLLMGLGLVPSLLLVAWVVKGNLAFAPFNLLVIGLGLGVGIYLFFVVGLFVCGAAERLLSLGFKPGKYPTDSPLFLRWIVYSGVHTIALSMFLPYTMGSGFVQLYYRLIGCKMGKNVFINTVGLHDAYLLTLGDNVVVGGRSDLTCHIFEGDVLELGRITVGDHVVIGANSYVMPGVTIASHTGIGPNALLRKNQIVESDTVLMTLPALPIRQVSQLLKLAKKVREKPVENREEKDKN